MPGFSERKRTRYRQSGSILFCGILFMVSSLFGQLSPGPLHQTHANLEGIKNCTQCHERGKQIAPEKCLGCHTVLKTEIEAGSTIHARPEYRQCQSCHVEHHGRDYDLIFWDKGRDNFDHAITGYRLEGKHTGLDCRTCHQEKNIKNPDILIVKNKNLNRTFLGLNHDCISCHRDEHRGQLGKECLRCHSMSGWQGAGKFNHNETRFPLTGKHRSVDCNECHKMVKDIKYIDDNSYRQYTNLTFQNCADCHQDIHQGQLGKDCQNCHNTAGWRVLKQAGFDHDRTAFPLKGQHRSITCEQCHLPGAPLKITSFQQCRDCHKDYHQGQFGHRDSQGECSECHNESGFIPANFTIDQHHQTEFPLDGSHLAVPCIDCHQTMNAGSNLETIQFRFQSIECQVCHDSPHQKDVDRFLPLFSSLSHRNGCEYCHHTSTWSEVSFDHDLTDFPLTGAHQLVGCCKCHPSQTDKHKTVVTFTGKGKTCQECHTDIHNGQFAESRKSGTDCARCHTTERWELDNFDHNRDSRFQMTGAHASLTCGDCHQTEELKGVSFIRYKPIDPACSTCH